MDREFMMLELARRVGVLLLRSRDWRTRERAEANLRRLFPQACVDRMVADTVAVPD